MRKLILFVVLFALQQITYGQCDQKVVLKSKSVKHLQHGAIKDEMSLDASISMDKERIVLTASADGMTETVDCEIKEVVMCDWKEYLKNGKAQYKVLGKKGDEPPRDAIVRIVSENGNTKVTIEEDPDPKGNSLELNIDSYSITEDSLPTSVPVKTEQKQKKTKMKVKIEHK